MTAVDGSVALVTGACGGIGAAVAAALTAGGAEVLGADLPGLGADIDLDITDPSSVDRVVAAAVARRGRVDIVVHTAGVGVGGVVEDLRLEDWQRAIDVNVWGTIHLVRAVYPLLIAQGSGHLVLVASLAGLVPTPLLVPYATSKAAVVGLAAGLRPEAARHGIGVSTVCPGPVDTPFLRTGGVGGGVPESLDGKRYLESAAGPAVTPERVAKATLAAIRRNRAVVVPGARAGGAWRAGRLFPSVAERVVAKAMRQELAQR